MVTARTSVVAIFCFGVTLVGCKKEDSNPQLPVYGTIQGKVTNLTGDTTIVGAIVTTSPGTSSVSTSSDGSYTIPNVSAGQYVVTAAKGGRNPGNVSITVQAGNTTTANIHMGYAEVNIPPDPPSLLAPLQGSVEQPTAVTLGWSGSDPNGDPVTYDVFFDTNNPPSTIVSSNQSTTTNVRNSLDTATAYFWRVTVKDSRGGSTSGSVWSFTTRHDTIPTQGLVAFYPFSGNASDASGNGHHGSLHGPTLTSDRFGKTNRAYTFNGSYISIPHSSQLSFSSAESLSIELWVYRTTNSAPMHALGKRVECFTNSMNYQIALSYDNLMVGVSIPVNVWTHLCLTYDGSTYRLYLDGEFRGSETSQLFPPNTAELRIGNSDDCPTFWQGKIDDVRIYRRTLNNDEIQRLYHIGGW